VFGGLSMPRQSASLTPAEASATAAAASPPTAFPIGEQEMPGRERDRESEGVMFDAANCHRM